MKKKYCDNTLCENPVFKEVPVSVRRAGDQKRSLCAACEEAYSTGVQHGTFVAREEAAILDDRELATVLAALRYHQAENLQGTDGIVDQAALEIASDGGCLKPLSREEIDALCERLNLGAVLPATPAACRVIVTVSGGVADVISKPRGVAVTVYDYDIEDSGEALSQDPDGKTCQISEWEAAEAAITPKGWPVGQ